MTDLLAAQLAAVDEALTNVIATLHDRELRCFCVAGHETEAYAWAGRVDEIQNIRQTLWRIPFVQP